MVNKDLYLSRGVGMNYLYVCDSEMGMRMLLGSLLRAIGHDWKVLVFSDNKVILQILERLKTILKEDMLIVNEELEEKVKLVVVDSQDNLFKWRELLGKKVHIVALNLSGDFDLVTVLKTKNLNKEGVIAVTGNGKGKTTLGLGIALENVLLGSKSLVISWFKEKKNKGLSWKIGEHYFEEKILGNNFKVITTGLGFFGSPNMDRLKGRKSYVEHCLKAKEGMEIVRREINNGFDGLIVLDELVDTVKEIAQNIEYPLIKLDELRNFLREVSESRCKVIVTGRRVNEYWEDLVSVSYEMEMIKHPWFDVGLPAIMGLDY